MIGVIGVIGAVIASLALYRIANQARKNGEFWAALGGVIGLVTSLSIGAIWSAPLILLAGLGGMKLVDYLSDEDAQQQQESR